MSVACVMECACAIAVNPWDIYNFSNLKFRESHATRLAARATRRIREAHTGRPRLLAMGCPLPMSLLAGVSNSRKMRLYRIAPTSLSA